MTAPVSIDTEMELYLAPEATGVYDWYPFTPLATDTVRIRRGQEDLADDPTPGQSEMNVRDDNGNLNPENPTGLYYGSIDRGTPQRVAIRRALDTFTRTSASGWAGSWTNGLSSGGTIAGTDWTVASNTARHSLPVAPARRTSDWNLASQLQADAEVRITVTFPVASANVAPISTEIWLRADANGLSSAQLIVNPGGGISLGLYDIVNGVTSVRLTPTVTGLSNLANQTWKFAAQVEGMTLRAKVWAASSPEPLDWTVAAHGFVVRRGWVSVSSFVDTGNTNTKPLVFIYDDFKLRLPLFHGELIDIRPTGDGKSSGAKKVKLLAHDVLNRLQAPGSPEESLMRRSRARIRRWWYVDGPTASSGTTNTLVFPTSSAPNTAVGDFFFLTALGLRKEDTQFRITSVATGGGNTTIGFTPTARSTVLSGDSFAIYRESPVDGAPTGYWPMEEGNQSTQIASGLPGGLPGDVTIGTPDFAADSTFPVSKPIMRMNGSEMKFKVPVYNATVFTVVVLITMPEVEDAATGQNLFDVIIRDGTARYAAVQYLAGGSLRLVMSDASGGVVFQTVPIAFGMLGTAAQITLRLEQVGGTVTYYLATTKLDGSLSGPGGTATGVTTLGTAEAIRLNPGGGYDNVGVGHLTFAPKWWDLFTTYFDVTGWNNRAALQRHLRMCWEERIPASYWDHWDVVSSSLGQQKVITVFDALKQIIEMDGGFLTGPKGELGLNLRTRGSLYNQSPAFTLHGGTGGHIDNDGFDPTFDYAETINRVTVNRIDGATVVSELTSGRLSTAMPPNGIGYREKAFTVSAGTDAAAGLLADERKNTGVIRGPRIKEMGIRPSARNSISIEQMTDLNIGNRIDVDTLDSRNVYGTLSQILVGYTLELSSRFDPRLSLNCTRYEPYRAFALTGDDRARPDMVDHVMNATVNTVQLTGFQVKSTSDNYVITSRASDFPMVLSVAGEHIMVTGATTPSPGSTIQTLTVSQRSVNGVVKAHVAGHTINLAYPNRAARR